jgi:sugar lactone lactonase YvrE
MPNAFESAGSRAAFKTPPEENFMFKRHPGHTLAGLVIALIGACAQAQGNSSVRTVVVAQQSAPSFLEAIAVGPDNAIYVNDFHGRQILRYVDDKGFSVHARVDVHPWGLVFDSDGTLYFGAAERGIVDKTSPPAQLIYRQRKGEAPQLALKIEAAKALNGMTLLAPGRILIADGRGGVIWHFDTRTNSATRFIQDETLDVPADFKLPTPAANGVKIHQGHLYISNTARGLMQRVRLGSDLAPAGKVEVFADQVRADDFIFSPAGNLYFTTHRTDVMKITPDRQVSKVPNIGPELVGSTALAWRPGDDGPFAINDGGFVAHFWYGGPVPAASNLVRIHGLE